MADLSPSDDSVTSMFIVSILIEETQISASNLNGCQASTIRFVFCSLAASLWLLE